MKPPNDDVPKQKCAFGQSHAAPPMTSGPARLPLMTSHHLLCISVDHRSMKQLNKQTNIIIIFFYICIMVTLSAIIIWLVTNLWLYIYSEI